MIEVNEGNRLARIDKWGDCAECDICDKKPVETIILMLPHPWSDVIICRECLAKMNDVMEGRA